jgi:hypothetical protein
MTHTLPLANMLRLWIKNFSVHVFAKPGSAG